MKIVTFGEIMLRLQPPNFQRFIQAQNFEAEYGGAEANVAASFASWGEDAYFVTKVPNNPIGTACLSQLKKYSINTKYIKQDGERLGIYFCEKGASQRASNVVYDRANSAISNVTADDFNWTAIFKDADWFHFSGITPALGQNVADICLIACQKAKELGVKVSCDLNYRKKLWSKEQANKTMTQLLEYVDVCIANEEDADNVLGIKAPDTEINEGKVNKTGYSYVAREICKNYGCEYVAISFRESISASENGWSGMLYSAELDDYFISRKYDITIIDRVGSGDAFASGIIYGLYNQYSEKDAINFAAAAGALKHSIEGDMNLVSLDEVKKLMSGDGSGRITR